MDIGDDLKNKQSILWTGATLYEDHQIVSVLVDKIVSGDKVHKKKCVEKILLNIQKEKWQEQYPVRTFIFLVYYSFLIKPGDIKMMLSSQALEIIYYLKFGKSKSKNFKDFIVELYKDFYGFNFQDKTANVIRIIRNNVAHTGIIDGALNSYATSDEKAIQDFIASNKLSNIRSVAFSFNFLVSDMVIRILGLNLADLSRNLKQPFNLGCFKKS